MNWQFLFLLCAGLTGSVLRAQETGTARVPEPITLAQAEQLFQTNNLMLLAGHYQIEAARAQVVQQKLWDNPQLSLEHNLYNPTTGRVLEVNSPTATQQAVQLQQLIPLAGKRGYRVRVAELSARQTEYELYDLLRSLRYALRQTFFELHFTQASLALYNDQIGSLRHTVALMEVQQKKGNLSLKEFTRVKAFLFQLENERTETLNQLADLQRDFRTLLGRGGETDFRPVVDTDRYRIAKRGAAAQSLAFCMETASEYRYDLKGQATLVELRQADHALQRAMAVPDLTTGLVYDRIGSAFPHYTGVTLGITLPLWNRNQGNIRMARALTAAEQGRLEHHQLTLENEVVAAYQKVHQTEARYQNIDPSFADDFDRLQEGVLQNFEKRNVTLLEFLDFYESYKESILQLYRLENDRIRAYEELNYVVGKTLFNDETTK
ncbi:outer membrane protein, cobalt-zinc-cadmium efflux system [Catalinimonas alkaloidigena]|uniref:Outer membrane protein, cobalt-zinc-cadmium efflux system n=1 Tax=Catalinimonas alkaloidigena TaxID=1075417 RepID=A0A1G9HVN1_9BACT|nr:TolC family protein [Catalinimonas alkaloidigena]SDL17030.1 outer membrane protein, cobalt-zinc-cadmium efflux system [Catalinimonas alkaloidigena]